MRPRRAAVPRLEAQGFRGFERSSVDRLQQRALDPFLIRKGVTIDDAVARPMLKRNLPAPTPVMRDRPRELERFAGPLAGQRQSAIARQPRAPVFELGPQGLADDQCSKAGAVDKEI